MEKQKALRTDARELPDKANNCGDVLPDMPEGIAEYRLAKERPPRDTTPEEKPLTHQESTFIKAYFANGFNARDACQRAGIPYRTVSHLIHRPHVRREMDRIQNETSKALEINQHRILGDLLEMFSANLADAVEHRRGSCRYCWGDGGKYHWRSERERDDLNSVPPGTRLRPTEDEPTRGQQDGGTGYDEYRAPNPDCIECAGQGLSLVLLKDTVGRKGVASVEYSPSGKVSIKGFDKVKIADLILKHIAMPLLDAKHSKTPSAPLLNINVSGGLPVEFVDALKDKGGLSALESFIKKDGETRVAQIEADATAEEQAEIEAMIKNGEDLD